MSTEETLTEAQFHRKTAVGLFNHVWTLMEKTDRTPAETDEMVHAAHASRHHWSKIGTSVNLDRGEWQVSRVYCVLGRSESAIYHAQRCLALCLESGVGDWDLAFAYEALSRAHAIAGNSAKSKAFFDQAHQAAKDIAEDEDRELLLSDLKTIPGLEG